MTLSGRVRDASRRTAAILVVVAVLLVSGCAKVPESTGVSSTLLRVRLKVRGRIQSAGTDRPMTYFVLIHRTDDPNDPGPVPVVAPPWGGNGFATASQPGAQGFVGFIRYDASGYGVYSLEVAGVLHRPEERIFQYLGNPEFAVTPREGESELFAQIDLGRLPRPTARYVQVNLVATDNLPSTPDNQPKLWDALEDGTQPTSLQPWVLLDTTVNDRRTNAATGKEPAWIDVRDRQIGPAYDEPNLDIVDWDIEVQRR